MVILEVAHPQEPRGNLDNMILLLLLKSRLVDVGDMETLAHYSSGPRIEHTWQGWTDVRCNSIAPPGYSPTTPIQDIHNIFHCH